METLTYDYFSPAPQSYNYVEFDGDSSSMLLKDGLGAIFLQSLENVDTGNFIQSYGFNAFDAAAAINPAAMTPQLQHSESVSPQPQQSSISPNGDSGIFLGDLDHDRARRNSSEEKDNCLTPAQSRRKAQNRAAQRAFRERKEKHVRDLEAKLNLLTTTTSTLQSDNERLKLLLRRAQTENEILRATTAGSTRQQQQQRSNQPVRFMSSDDLCSLPGQGHSKEEPIHGRISTTATGGNGLSASATWDLLQSHLLYHLSGAVDIGEVCERLKKLARCEEEQQEVRKDGSSDDMN